MNQTITLKQSANSANWHWAIATLAAVFSVQFVWMLPATTVLFGQHTSETELICWGALIAFYFLVSRIGAMVGEGIGMLLVAGVNGVGSLLPP